MSFPAGVETCTIVHGKGVSVSGDFTSATLRVDPIFPGIYVPVWEADGTPLLAISAFVIAYPGFQGSMDVPVVDQPGWIDGTLAPYSMWGYRLTETATGPGGTFTRVKNVQPLSGQMTIDFDMIPD